MTAMLTATGLRTVELTARTGEFHNPVRAAGEKIAQWLIENSVKSGTIQKSGFKTSPNGPMKIRFKYLPEEPLREMTWDDFRDGGVDPNLHMWQVSVEGKVFTVITQLVKGAPFECGPYIICGDENVEVNFYDTEVHAFGSVRAYVHGASKLHAFEHSYGFVFNETNARADDSAKVFKGGTGRVVLVPGSEASCDYLGDSSKVRTRVARPKKGA